MLSFNINVYTFRLLVIFIKCDRQIIEFECVVAF